MLELVCSFRNSKKVCFEGPIQHKDLVASVTCKGHGSAQVVFSGSEDGRVWAPIMLECAPSQVYLGDGNSNKTDFLFDAGKGIEPGSLRIELSEGVYFYDDKAGKVHYKWANGEREVGTINYLTGEIDIRVERGTLKKSDQLIAQFNTGRNWVMVTNGSHDLAYIPEFSGQCLMVGVVTEDKEFAVNTYLYSNCHISVLGKVEGV